MTVDLPFSRPSLGAAELSALSRVLDSGWITTGAEVAAFEAEFAAAVGACEVVAVNSATAGFDLLFQALRLAPEDEVILPSLNWVSGPNMVELAGARCVFADVRDDDCQIDVEHVARLITPRTRAIMPVHFAGIPAELSTLRELSEHHGLVLIEDAAHAHGAVYKGTKIGAAGSCAVFSCHPTKNITCGEGGLIACRDAEQASALRQSRFHGISKNAWKHRNRSGNDGYDLEEPSRKYNLTDLAAAIGRCQLERLPQFNQRRQALAERYLAALGDHALVRCLQPSLGQGSQASWHIFPVRLRPGWEHDRSELAQALAARGIGTGLHYPAVHQLSYYRRRYPDLQLPNSDAAGASILSLPLFPDMSDDDCDRVCSALDAIAEEWRR